MALENQNNDIENQNRNIEELKSRLNNPYLKEFLLERLNSKLETAKKNEFLSQFSTLSLQEKRTYRDYISSIMKNDPTIIKDFDDDLDQITGLLKSMDKLEIYAGVCNNCVETPKKEMPNYESTYNPETTHQSRNETPSYENTYHISNRNRAQEFIESNEKAPYHIEITGGTIIQKTLTASFKHGFDNKNVTYNILGSNVHYRGNGFYEIDLFAKGGHIKNEKSILIRYDGGDAFVLWNAVTNEPSGIAKVSGEGYSINGPDISIHGRKVNLEFKQNGATINLSISITPKINTYNNGDY